MSGPVLRLFCVSFLLLAISCSRHDPAKNARPKVVPATGLVTYKGQPVADAIVVFVPDPSTGVPANATTDGEGKFILKAFDPDEGAVPGKYKVTVSKVEIPPPPPSAGHDQVLKPVLPKYHVPQKYEDPEKSGLTAEVVEGQPNDFKLELKD